jgi:Fe-S-cluster-containing dehydrogenase component
MKAGALALYEEALGTSGTGLLLRSAGSATPTSGSSSTIGAERAANIALASDDEDKFVKELVAGLNAYPRYYEHMGPANRRGPDAPDLTSPAAAGPAELRQRIEAGGWVVDLRQRRDFAGRHLAGSVSVELGDPFATYLGWTMAWGTPLTLVGDSADQVARGQRELARIGIAPAAAAAGTIEQLAAGRLTSYQVADFAGLAAGIGCHACTTACKSENEVPLGVTRTYVKSAEVGTFPQVRRAFQVTRCNQCADAPCVAACPTQAMYRRPDGIVDFDKEICVGCKACIAACPYDAIFINPQDNAAEKCNLCAHRLEIGLEPACVTVCPVEAILVGDLNDPGSRAARIVKREPVAVRKPEKGTRPGLFYKGAHQATLDPLAARRPDGGLFAWATQGGEHDPGHVTSGHPHGGNSSAEALLSYDIGHHAPWGWRVSLYTWTKGVAAGALLVPLILILAGRLAWTDPLARWAAPAVALGFLVLTGILLIWDLRHPERFYLIFTRPHWRSWLVRGAFIIGVYGAAAALFGLGSLAGAAILEQVAAGFAIPLAVATAVYTAYLFAQARARDLWQSPLLAPHLAVQAVLAGAAATLAFAPWLGPAPAVTGAEGLLAAAAAAHVLLVLGEITVTHPTEHAHLAAAAMIRGRYARWFWPGLAAVAVAIAAPWAGPAVVPFALAGLLAHEHAYVQAGQSVPLA